MVDTQGSIPKEEAQMSPGESLVLVDEPQVREELQGVSLEEPRSLFVVVVYGAKGNHLWSLEVFARDEEEAERIALSDRYVRDRNGVRAEATDRLQESRVLRAFNASITRFNQLSK